MDAGQSFDRFSVQPLGGGSLGQHCRRARVDPERPVRAGGVGKLGELGERTDRALRLAAAHGSLDELRQFPDRRPQHARVLGGPLGRRQGIVVAAEPVIALRAAPLVGNEPQPLAASQHIL